MAEANNNGTGLKIKTAFGELATTGTTVFIVIALSALTGLSLWEHYKRRQEHESLECTLQLSLYFQTLPKGTAVAWNEIPSEYWRCLPRVLVEKGTSIR